VPQVGVPISGATAVEAQEFDVDIVTLPVMDAPALTVICLLDGVMGPNDPVPLVMDTLLLSPGSAATLVAAS
jgi:hypothetical protein